MEQTSVAVLEMPMVDMPITEEGLLPIKNTFVHFEKARRSLRMSQSEPMDPKLPPLNKLEGFAEKVEYGMDGAGVDCVDAETTDECSDEDVMSIQTLEMTPRQTDADGLSLQTPEMTPRHIDADVLSIQTPEMTPRHMDVESPVHSSTVSLTGTPGSWTAAQFPVQEHQVVPAWNSQGASETMLIPAEPAWYLQLPADPALLYPPYSLTLRLAEKGGLGIKFGNLPGCDTLFVRRIVPLAACLANKGTMLSSAWRACQSEGR